MNRELKEQMRKDFDKKIRELCDEITYQFPGQDEKSFFELDPDKVKSFIDSIIDKTVQAERERIVEELVSELTTPICMEDTGICTDKITYDCIKYRAEKWLKDQLPLITNKNDSNKEERECNCGKGKIEGAQGCCGLCSSI